MSNVLLSGDWVAHDVTLIRYFSVPHRITHLLVFFIDNVTD